jgi:hypothetical protein
MGEWGTREMMEESHMTMVWWMNRKRNLRRKGLDLHPRTSLKV